MSGKKPGLGKKLSLLHRWNGWVVLALTVSGLLLAWEAVRGWLDGEARNPIKQLHIALGLLSAALIALYIPLMKRHLKQIRQRPRQKGNLGFVLVLLVGWFLSGVVLWQIRRFPPEWANGALLVHDVFTWIGVPYILYHSITRIRWMRKPERRAIRTTDDEPVAPGPGVAAHDAVPTGGDVAAARNAAPMAGSVAGAPTGEGVAAAQGNGRTPGAPGSLKWEERSPPAQAIKPYEAPRPVLNRKQFLKWTAGAVLTAAVAPSFIRWLNRAGGFGGGGGGLPGVDEPAGAANANLMTPDPIPLPDSANVVGGGAQGYFRVYTVTPLPVFDSQTWSFTIDGLVEQPQTWNWERFLALKREVQVSDFHCVTGWSVYNNTWEGIRLAALLREAGVQSAARFVKFYSGDGVYTDSLSLEQAEMDDILVAVLHDGKPIHRDYGGPVRLVVPRMYAYKSVKWLDRIELIDKDHIGYWEQRGYDKDAWIRT